MLLYTPFGTRNVPSVVAERHIESKLLQLRLLLLTLVPPLPFIGEHRGSRHLLLRSVTFLLAHGVCPKRVPSLATRQFPIGVGLLHVLLLPVRFWAVPHTGRPKQEGTTGPRGTGIVTALLPLSVLYHGPVPTRRKEETRHYFWYCRGRSSSVYGHICRPSVPSRWSSLHENSEVAG